MAAADVEPGTRNQCFQLVFNFHFLFTAYHDIFYQEKEGIQRVADAPNRPFGGWSWQVRARVRYPRVWLTIQSLHNNRVARGFSLADKGDPEGSLYVGEPA